MGKKTKGGRMGKNIFSALIIVGLCFGQGIWLKENQKINLPMPINGAIRSVNPLSPNNLMMQVEGESLQPKTSFWKQTGIYGLEFAVAGVSTTICGVMAFISMMEEGDVGYWHPERIPFVYVGTNLLITSSSTWGIGRLLGQKGTWWKTAVGTGMGSIATIAIAWTSCRPEVTFASLGLTALGAVVGFNF